MNSEDKLIERLRTYAAAKVEPRCFVVAENDGLRIGPNMYRGICEQAADALSTLASRIEELEKALAVARGGLFGASKRLGPGAALANVARVLPIVDAALSDHPDKEGGK